MALVDHLMEEAEAAALEETVATEMGEEEPPDESLHGVCIKRPRGRPKKMLPADYHKATERFRVRPECYYCLACDTAQNDTAEDLPLLCKHCYTKYEIEGHDDPVQDIALLHFLYHNQHKLGVSQSTAERVNCEAKRFHIDFKEARPTQYVLLTKRNDDQWR